MSSTYVTRNQVVWQKCADVNLSTLIMAATGASKCLYISTDNTDCHKRENNLRITL